MQHWMMGDGAHLRRLARWPGVAALAAGLLTLAACGTEPAARVNGEVITRAEVQRDMRDVMDFLTVSQGVNWSGNPQAQAQLGLVRSQVLTDIIDARLVRQQAAAEGITVGERDIEQRTNELIELTGGRDEFMARLQERGLTALAFRQFIKDDLLRARLAERHVPVSNAPVETRRIRHLLVDTAEAATAARERLARGESWETVAAEVSKDPGSRTRGGDLGFLAQGDTVPAFDQAAFALPVNELSQPVQTSFGYHILQVTEVKSQPATPEQQQSRQQRAFEAYLGSLRQQAEIQYLEPGLAQPQASGRP